MTPAGAPTWIELYSPDLGKAQRFYGELLGWHLQDMGEEFGHYHMIMLGDRVVGGAMRTAEGMGPPSLCVYLATDDIGATTQRVRDEGGQVVVEPMELPDGGTMAFYLDNTGAAIGAWQHDQDVMQARNEPGASAWYEIMTSDYEASERFYAQVFGWEIVPMGDDTDEMRYATNGAADDAVAGLCDASSFIPSKVPESYWRVYLNVADFDAAIAKVPELGGRVLDGPEDSPWGRLATIADDQGVTFQLIS